MHNRIVTENQLDEWVRGNAREAQEVIVELIYRLVSASSPYFNERRFPLGDSIGQHGSDGYLDTDLAFNSFIPEGKSFWEIGTGTHARKKATSDYEASISAIPSDIRSKSTFIFVTPLSGRRDWKETWKDDGQSSWLNERRERKDWNDIRVIDGTKIIDWLQDFPSVELWLANTIGLPGDQIETPEQHWANLRTIGEPPPLIPDIFLSNREEACVKLGEIFSGKMLQLKLDTRYIDQVGDFVAAYIAHIGDDIRFNITGRCLFLSGIEAWKTITSLRESHFLVADFDLNENDSLGTKLIQQARRSGHAVIFGGMPGGVPHPYRVSIPNPKVYQIREALVKSGYNEERARLLAQQSSGNLSSLLRCLQNLSLMPEWAQGTEAAELAIVEILATWDENHEADKTIVEQLSGNSYGEWIGKIRNISLRPGTPLIQRDGIWKFVARYEGWFALGQQIFDEHLDRLKDIAVSVLREKDPIFELPPEERFAANLRGKVLTHSNSLRHGLAETLALLGSHPQPLTSCSFGKAEGVARYVVREILTNADWVLWASLNHLLPLLAEAAPGEFLKAVENSLSSETCPFDHIFAQERPGITGNNYTTGLLWALESLAWDEVHLTRVVVILGELADRDPGGNWGNRPANSLTTILLPWLPQTCASIETRCNSVKVLFREVPEVAWNCLLTILPKSHGISSGSHKPLWRRTIPEDWSERVTQEEYLKQVDLYLDLLLEVGKQDTTKFINIVQRFNDFTPPIKTQILNYLRSKKITSLSEVDRMPLWTTLVDLITKHRKFADAEWAMAPSLVDEIEVVTSKLEPENPVYRYQRLFNEGDFELFEAKENFDEQRRKLEERRQKAIKEVFTFGGLEAVLALAQSVNNMPWRVGAIFGVIANKNSAEEKILPNLLGAEVHSLFQFAGGFIRGKFRENNWQWVDTVNMSHWNPSQIGQFFAFLPFVPNTWERVEGLLGEDQSPYWSTTSVDPYQTGTDLDFAINRLIQHGRPHEAIGCLESILHNNASFSNKQAIDVLNAVLHAPESLLTADTHALVTIIKALQDDPNTNHDELCKIEWAFLPLLSQNHGASPILLQQELANNPDFFCEVIRTVFRSKDSDESSEEPTEQQKNMATNAYRLLQEWRIPPGSQKDGTFDGEVLSDWLNKIKSICSKSGHLEIALSMLGHVLTYTPHDPDGLWLHHAVAEALNAKDARSMRDGFTTELFNSRGGLLG